MLISHKCLFIYYIYVIILIFYKLQSIHVIDVTTSVKSKMKRDIKLGFSNQFKDIVSIYKSPDDRKEKLLMIT